MITKFQGRLDYLQRRKLAESLSHYLSIPLHDDFSSFDEEIYASKNYSKRLETIEILELDFPERFEFQTVENTQIILFPTFIIKPAVIILSVIAIGITLMFLALLVLTIPQGGLSAAVTLVLPYSVIMLFILAFALIFFGSISRDRITSDDSITLTRRYFWGQTTEVFTSSLKELQEVNIFPFFDSALLLFRSLKNAKSTAVHPEQEMIQISHFLNRLLMKKGKR